MLPQNADFPQVGDPLEERMLWFASRGWPVFPIAPNSKVPMAKTGGVKDATTDADQIREWARLYPNANIGGACTGRVVIDIDPRNGGSVEHDFPATLAFRTGGGGLHLVYASGRLTVKSGSRVLGEGVDVKAGKGSYIVLPTSRHPDGGYYEFGEGTEQDLPKELYYQLTDDRVSATSGPAMNERSILSNLLLHPPQVGSRNEWLARVAGHYAKHYRKNRDLYDLHIDLANRLLASPLPSDEVAKTSGSLWSKEHTGNQGRDFEDLVSESSGWLAEDATGRRLLALGKLEGMGKKDPAIPISVTDFAPRVLGRLYDPEADESTFELEVVDIRGNRRRIQIANHQFGDSRALNKALANEGLSLACDGTLMTKSPLNIRLLRYLTAQDAPVYQVQRYIGWSALENGFVLANGVIDAHGLRPHYRKAAPAVHVVEDTSKYVCFGTERDWAYARDCLRRVMQFQDETVTAVFGAWWAARLARHLLERKGQRMFPAMAIEAGSEAGKTTGFFNQLLQLAGVYNGGVPTPAVARNRASFSQIAPIWIDDPNSTGPYMELLRAATQGGEQVKMDATATRTTTFILRAPIVLSGEYLDMDTEKAMLDRTVRISPPSPVGRMSATDPKRPQIRDIDALDAEWVAIDPARRGAALAGHFLAWAARHEAEIDRVIDEIGSTGSGRRGVVGRTLQIGAILLDQMLNPKSEWKGSENLERVKLWLIPPDEPMVGGAIDESQSYAATAYDWDNVLTRKILPAAMRMHWKDDHIVNYRDDGRIRFNVSRLARWWSEYNRGQIGRVESEGALRQQAQALHAAGKSEQHRTSGNRGWLLSEAVSEVIYRRSRE